MRRKVLGSGKEEMMKVSGEGKEDIGLQPVRKTVCEDVS